MREKNKAEKPKKLGKPPKLKAPVHVSHYEIKVSELKDVFKLIRDRDKIEIKFAHAGHSLSLRESFLLGEALLQITQA